MSNEVLTHVDADGNATVMLNRPEVHNAFDPAMTRLLTASLEKLDANPKVRAVVLLGAGKSFCAGADIGHMKASAKFSRAQNYQSAQESARMFYTLYNLSKPTIACVHGAVRGGGIGLVAACDIAIAARTATFRLSEVKIGVIPSMISPYVIAAIGERHARRYFISGEEFDAAEAWRMSLIHDMAEDEALNGTVGAMLGQLYTSGPQAMAAAKKLIPLGAHATIGKKILDETARRIADIRATREGQEGLSAFLEKRQPDWVEPKKIANKKKPKKS
ncbi:MAG: enoyl-CoA hydratase/isomerase family protein [Burkholderiales bacterium]